MFDEVVFPSRGEPWLTPMPPAPEEDVHGRGERLQGVRAGEGRVGRGHQESIQETGSEVPPGQEPRQPEAAEKFKEINNANSILNVRPRGRFTTSTAPWACTCRSSRGGKCQITSSCPNGGLRAWSCAARCSPAAAAAAAGFCCGKCKPPDDDESYHYVDPEDLRLRSKPSRTEVTQ
ncbi:hypothetical protein INR49_004084 [Caranx melampygus]|nr:hypothetical protein INR49_004084 [Caranx melampygus]